MGLIGILLGLALLMWLALRGWSVLLLAPAAALFAAALAMQPLLAGWTQTFMISAAVRTTGVHAMDRGASVGPPAALMDARFSFYGDALRPQ